MATDGKITGAGGAHPVSAARKPRRRWLIGALIVLIVLIVLPLGAAGALWLRLGAGPLRVPPAITARIEARLDGAMAANGLSLSQIEVHRPNGGAAAALALRLIDVRLSDADGAPRAAFPVVAARLSLAGLMRGQVRPISVALSDAGFSLSRDASGQIDLALSAGDAASSQSLTETLARLDAMLSAPVFAALDEVTATGLSLAMRDAMTGQVMRVSDGQMRLTRADGVLSLNIGGALAGTRDATIDLAVTRAAGLGETDIGLGFSNLAARDVATIGPALAWVDLMRAPISGFLGGVLNDDGTLGDLRASLDIGPGQVRLDDATAPLPFDRMVSALSYRAATGRISFDSVSLLAPDLSFAASGHADVGADGTSYVAQMRIEDIDIARPDVFAAPLHLDRAFVDLRLELAPRLVIQIGQAVVQDDGLDLRLRGRIAAEDQGLSMGFDAHLPEAGVDQIMTYWPPAAIPRTRSWVADHLSAGRLRGVDFALRRTPGRAPAYALDFDFEDVTLAPLPNFPPITDAAGYFALDGPRLSLRLDQGGMAAPGGGVVALDGSHFLIADTRPRGPEAVIDLTIAGAVPDVLTVLTAPPVRLFSQGTMTPERIGTGTITARGQITTRLMRQEGMGNASYDFAGEISDFASDTLVPGRSLAADRLQIAVDPQNVTISGEALFDGVPVTGQWTRALGAGADPESRVAGRARLTPERLAGVGVRLPDWMFSGQAIAAIDLRLPDGATPLLRLSSDLAGARLALPPLGWVLAPDQTGQLEADITLGPTPAVTRLSLNAGALTLEGRIDLADGGGFDRLVADRFRLANWLDVTGLVQGRAAAAPLIQITGGTLDLRGAPQIGPVGPPDGAGGGPITVALDRLQISEGIALTGLNADLTADAGLSGQFRGRVNGEALVSGTLVPTTTGPAVRVRADDGGAVLRSAGVFQTAYGGAMELILQATGAGGGYDGTLSIDAPRLRDAPVMAELLNLISVVGLLEQLSGDGINLGEVDASFRLTPGQVILRQGTAVGSSLGLSMDGTYDLASRNLDMQGVVSPLYLVNGLVGALFAQRREGLFGFSYRLTGQAGNPQVTVNPLSILTPGVFRDIFRRPPPDVAGN